MILHSFGKSCAIRKVMKWCGIGWHPQQSAYWFHESSMTSKLRNISIIWVQSILTPVIITALDVQTCAWQYHPWFSKDPMNPPYQVARTWISVVERSPCLAAWCKPGGSSDRRTWRMFLNPLEKDSEDCGFTFAKHGCCLEIDRWK